MASRRRNQDERVQAPEIANGMSRAPPRGMSHRMIWTVSLLGMAFATEASATARDADALSLGPYHSCAVTSCGEVQCWGRSDWGQSADRLPTVPPYLIGTPVVPRFEQVSVGQYHTCALDEDGDVDCWGKGNYGQSADRSGPFVDLDAGYNHNCAIRQSDGGIECWGTDSHGAVSGTPSGSFIDVSAGIDYACAIPTGGAGVQCWGYDSYGQAPSYLEAPNFEAGETFTSVSAGSYHACAVSEWEDGETLYCWGYGPYASLNGWAAELEPGLYWYQYYDVLAVDAGSSSTVVSRLIGSDSEVFGFGWLFGSYPIPAGTTSDVAAVGSNHWCTVDDVGDVSCTGNDAYGKATPPSTSGSCPGIGWIPTFPTFP